MKILFFGCGKMGSILVENLLSQGSATATQITIIKKSEKNKIPGLNYIKDLSSLPRNYQADLVFLAIKPQGSKEILSSFANSRIFHKKTIFVSILAGKKVEFFEQIFGQSALIIRSMPNLPIKYQQGVFLYFPNKNVKNSEIKKLEKIFDKFGMSFRLKDEKLFDAATAIFGSGPAYIFLLQEILADIAKDCGIKQTTAEKLVKKLFLGSALMSEFSEKKFSQLRDSVTSKKGTTEAGINILQKNSALKNLCEKTINAAIKRSKELSYNDC